MSQTIVDCGKKVLSSLTCYIYTNRDLNKIDSSAVPTTLYFGQEPVPGVYSVNEENKRFLVAIKPNRGEDEERLFRKYNREDYPFNSVLADPITFQNATLTLSQPSPIGVELKKQFLNGSKHKNMAELATPMDIDGKTNYAKAKYEKESSNTIDTDEPLVPAQCNFCKNFLHNLDNLVLTTTAGEQRNSSLTSSVFIDSTFSEPKNEDEGSSICSADIDECKSMEYTRLNSCDSNYPADPEDNDRASISGFSFRYGEDKIDLSSEWSHDEVPLSAHQGESSSVGIPPQKKKVHFSLQVNFKLPAWEPPKKPHTTTFIPKPPNKKNSPHTNDNITTSPIDIPGYAFLCKPLEITHCPIHARWFLKSELDQRTLYRNMCASYVCSCTDFCQGMQLRRWKLMDDGYSWVPKDEQVCLVRTPIPQAPSTSFWSRFRRKKTPQYITPATFRFPIEESLDVQAEQVHTLNESVYDEPMHIQSFARGDKIGTMGEMLFVLGKGEDGSVKMRVMSEEEIAVARGLQRERRGKFLVFEGNEEANAGLMGLARYLERGGEMVTFLCR